MTKDQQVTYINAQLDKVRHIEKQFLVLAIIFGAIGFGLSFAGEIHKMPLLQDCAFLPLLLSVVSGGFCGGSKVARSYFDYIGILMFCDVLKEE